MADFVHLHNHSEYSLLDGAASISSLVGRAAELEMKHLALTDHGNMFGALKFYRLARKAGIKPGMSMAQARGILPALLARGRDPSCEASAHEALLETAWSLSPRVEDAELAVSLGADAVGHVCQSSPT